MSAELELATGAVAADGRAPPRPKRGRTLAAPAVAHTECLNCGATLHGRFCAACGQGADDHHRSILHLMREWVEDLTHFDGRLMRTLPALFIRPGTLARDHFEGRRQRHVPPLRLFFVSLLLFMLALEGATHRGRVKAVAAPGLGQTVTVKNSNGTTRQVRVPSAEEISAMTGGRLSPAQIKALAEDKTPAPASAAAPVPPTPQQMSTLGGAIRAGVGPAPGSETPEQAFERMQTLTDRHKGPMAEFGRWMGGQGKKALASKEYFRSIIFEWAHRLAVLLLPIFAGLLSLCYVYRRKFFVYDHLVVSMHFLSFVFLLWGVTWLLPKPVSGPAFVLATLWTPVNLFMTLRGAYGSSLVGAAVKTLFLWIAALSLFGLMLLAVMFVALTQI